jgi:hypothetical protein
MNIRNELNDFINQKKDAKNFKIALVVKMILSGNFYQEIIKSLECSPSFISK